MKEYGTKLPVSKRNKLEEIKQEYIEKVDKYIAGDEVLKNDRYNITIKITNQCAQKKELDE